jgi:hypothetical protein
MDFIIEWVQFTGALFLLLTYVLVAGMLINALVDDVCKGNEITTRDVALVGCLILVAPLVCLWVVAHAAN